MLPSTAMQALRQDMARLEETSQSAGLQAHVRSFHVDRRWHRALGDLKHGRGLMGGHIRLGRQPQTNRTDFSIMGRQKLLCSRG